MYQALSLRVALAAILIYSLLFVIIPQPARAFGTAADAFCAMQRCFPGKCTPKDPGCVPCVAITCTDPGSNVTGQCVTSAPPGKCEAKNAPGLGGSSNELNGGMGGIVGQLLSGLLQKLMSPPPSSSSGGGAGGGAGTTPGCAQQQTSDFNVYSSNPSCFSYVPPVSSTLGGGTSGTGSGTGTSISDQLLNALGGTTGSTNTNTNTNTNVSEILSTSGNTNTNTNANTQTTGATSSAVIQSTPALLVPTGAANLLPGVRGDIQVFNSGATILAGQRDTTSNTEVAGFYGSNTFSGKSTGIAASLCQSRPWANGVFSKVIPASFFDSLCSLRGYQVGTPQTIRSTQVTVTQTAPRPVASTTAATTTPSVPAKVDIWAVPAKVSLGSRTSVFWNTQGVTQCTETSPDGSFSQSTLSGGASTVPITTATTFTISCLAADGSHVTDYVTVDLAI